MEVSGRIAFVTFPLGEIKPELDKTVVCGCTQRVPVLITQDQFIPRQLEQVVDQMLVFLPSKRKRTYAPLPTIS